MIPKEISTSTVARKPNLYDRWIINKLVELRDVPTDSGISPKGTRSPVSKLHDLQGRRLITPPQRGVYVRDGRKVVSKCEKGAVLEIK